MLEPSAYLISQFTSAPGFIPFSISIIVNNSVPLMLSFFLSKPSLNWSGKIPIPTRFDLCILSKLSAITAFIPNNFVPFAAQSLEEPVPYSLPATTTKFVPLFLYSIAASYTLICFPSGCNIVKPPSVPAAISFLILIFPNVPLNITSWLPLLAP